jgi:hypothetical protein
VDQAIIRAARMQRAAEPMGNAAIQDLMSQLNKAQTLSSITQKRRKTLISGS